MLSETGEKPFEGRLAFVLQDGRETHGASLRETGGGVGRLRGRGGARGGVGNTDEKTGRMANILNSQGQREKESQKILLKNSLFSEQRDQHTSLAITKIGGT